MVIANFCFFCVFVGFGQGWLFDSHSHLALSCVPFRRVFTSWVLSWRLLLCVTKISSFCGLCRAIFAVHSSAFHLRGVVSYRKLVPTIGLLEGLYRGGFISYDHYRFFIKFCPMFEV